MEKTIVIDNITSSDVGKNQIRIIVNNKHLFPKENPGNPKTYTLRFRTNNSEFDALYKIGSLDGRLRSGILKLGKSVYQEILCIEPGTGLKIIKESEELYSVAAIK